LNEDDADQLRNKALFKPVASGNSQVCFDFTHTHIDCQGVTLLKAVGEEMEIKKKVAGMFAGDHINNTENRKVWHVKLRSNEAEDETVKQVIEVQNKIKNFTDKIRSGEKTGFTDKKIKNFVCIGIGGSYLGPEFVYEALKFEE
jgi:glucose-6-phosphate isomerase